MNERQNLKAYLDGELSPGDRAQVEEALKQNPNLLTELDQLRSIGKRLHESSPTIEPTGMPATLERLRNDPGAQRMPWLLPATFAALTLVLVSTLTIFMGPKSEVPFRDESPMPLPKRRIPGAHPNGFKLVADAKLTVYVLDLDGAIKRVEGIAKSYGGFVVSKAPPGSAASDQRSLTVTVPSPRLVEVLSRLRQLGIVDAHTVPGKDKAPTKTAPEDAPARSVISVTLAARRPG